MRLLLISILLASPVLACDLRDDPAQRVAVKALRDDFGELSDWQRYGYEKLQVVTPKKQPAWITCYSEFDPGYYRTTASGRRVSMRVAAMIDKPWTTRVLIDLPMGFELRQVFDTSSVLNIGRAQHPWKYGSRRPPAETWVGRYSPYQSNESWVRSIYVW